jgi:hypothetical protein
MDQPEKVTLLSWNIDEAGHMVRWLVELPNGDHYPMSWPLDVFGKCMKLGDISVASIAEFSSKVRHFTLIRRGNADVSENIREC